jgi:hypothetical protein
MSNRIGAFWVKKIKNGEHAGETMLSGILSDLRGDFPVVAFKNRKKEKENQPDYILMTSEPKEEKKSIAQDVEGINQERSSAGDGVDAPAEGAEGINVGEIPF